jgi:diaminopimelate decarboxylase
VELHEKNGELCLGGARLGALADRLGTPLAVYDAESLIERFYSFVEAFASCRAMVCFAADAGANTQLMHRLVKRGAGLRVRRAVDLERAWLSGAPLSRVIYSGMGKTDNDIRAALDGLYSPLFQAGRLVEGKPPYYRGPVGWFSIETADELEQLARLAGGVRIACRVMVRVSLPQCSSSVLGASPEEVVDLFYKYGSDPRLRLAGLRVHLGRSGVSVDNFAAAAAGLCSLAAKLTDMGADITALNLGGGFACDAWDEDAPSPEAYARAIGPMVMPCVDKGVKLMIEPGWSIAAAGSVLVSRVLAVREVGDERIVIVDGVPGEPAELDRLRPVPVHGPETNDGRACRLCDVHVPSRCVMAPRRFEAGELIAWPGGGAYVRRGVGSASEVMYEDGRAFVIRPREVVADAVGPELESHEVIL